MPAPSPALAPGWAGHLVRLLGSAAATDRQGRSLDQDAAFGLARAAILDIRRAGRKVMVVGNGGSATLSSHLQTDLCSGLGVRALVFTEPAMLTAQANDHGYDQAFANQVDLWADPGDLLVAISSSGRSPNILHACARARARRTRILTFSGFRADNPLRALGDLNFHLASCEYGPVESGHGVLLHHLTDLVLEQVSGSAP
jgi:D-sedoheptulose 7-phosphate isomerase